uniref:PDE4B n=1 Tax=Cyanoderma ruficeps TaxID=181631 RepID=A0A8C3QNV6_9PASS
MKKSRSVMTVTADENSLDSLECGLSKSYSTSSHALGIDLWRGRRCCSGNLQLPPLALRQTERARTPDRDTRTWDRDTRTPDRDTRTSDRDSRTPDRDTRTPDGDSRTWDRD